MSGIFTHGLLKVNNWGSDKSVATKKTIMIIKIIEKEQDGFLLQMVVLQVW